MVEDIVSNYWVGKESSDSSCSNVSLFRFLGGLKFNFNGKKVLEVGYGGNNGADLLEAQKRGYQKIYLFTHSAESLYIRKGWNEIERHQIEGKNIVIMEKKYKTT